MNWIAELCKRCAGGVGPTNEPFYPLGNKISKCAINILDFCYSISQLKQLLPAMTTGNNSLEQLALSDFSIGKGKLQYPFTLWMIQDSHAEVAAIDILFLR